MRMISYRAAVPEHADAVLVPGGVTTPHGTSAIHALAGGTVTNTVEATTSQSAAIVAPTGTELHVTWAFDPSATGPYPDVVFAPTPSRYTKPAEALVAAALEAAKGESGPDKAVAVACHTADQFTYGHTDTPFDDGFDHIPALGCGLTEGYCVDINTYFIAALRAAGIEAGYLTGFFFPEEKDGVCDDGHCWVVTRIGGQTQAWDIAHHLKLGTRDIKPGLNPKPGWRAACFHSMGLSFPALGITALKAMIEPLARVDGTLVTFDAPEIRLLPMPATV